MKNFLEFCLSYYREKTEYYEGCHLNQNDIYEAKQLLKAVDDVVDEGYTALYQCLERENIVTRLHRVLLDNGETPFSVPNLIIETGKYGSEKYELCDCLDGIYRTAKSRDYKSDNTFIHDLRGFCEWIGREADTAYVFLLRDTLLPYMYFKDKGYDNLYPWLIGRKFLADMYGREGLDDDIRRPIFNAADQKIAGYDNFSLYCRKSIAEVLAAAPCVKSKLESLLGSVKQSKITVVESGCYGTMPMLLAAIDERVTVKMYTCVPFLREQYGEHIYTKAYENNRNFETLYAHDALMQYDSYDNGKFMVRISQSKKVYDKALAEINTMLG